jgi:hypothetical protein
MKLTPGKGIALKGPKPTRKQRRLDMKAPGLRGEPIMQIQPVPMTPRPVPMKQRSNAGITGPGGKSVNKIYNTY